jgi:hypothetical protein
LGPKVVIGGEYDEPVDVAESVAVETDPKDGLRQKVAEAGAAMLKDVINLRHLLEPYSRKRSLLVLDGVIDAQRVRELLPATKAVLASYERMAQVAPELEEEIGSEFAEFMTRRQKYCLLTYFERLGH